MSLRDVGGGWVEFDGVRLLPFPGWAGGFRLLETAADAYVGAGEGGGARYCVYDRLTKGKTFDGFADGDVTSRGGVHFVLADPNRGLTFGSGFPLYLLFEYDYGGGWRYDVARRVAELYANCNVRVTTRRPAVSPGDYGTCVIGPAAGWLPDAAGNAPTDRFGLTPGGYDPLQVYAQSLRDPMVTAACAAHECGHGFGLGHVTTPNSIMQPNAMPAGSFDEGLKAAIRVRTAKYAGRT